MEERREGERKGNEEGEKWRGSEREERALFVCYRKLCVVT